MLLQRNTCYFLCILLYHRNPANVELAEPEGATAASQSCLLRAGVTGRSVGHEQLGEISGFPGKQELTRLALTPIKGLGGATCQ